MQYSYSNLLRPGVQASSFDSVQVSQYFREAAA
jgi:hypothetical protein